MWYEVREGQSLSSILFFSSSSSSCRYRVRKVWNIEYDGVSAGSKDRSRERERKIIGWLLG